MTGERLKTWNYPISPIEFQSEILEFLENPHSTLTTQPCTSSLKANKPLSQLSEEEQMNMALRASLGENIDLEKDVIVIDDDEEQEPKKTLDQICASIQPKNPPEPSSSNETVRLQFRLPNGSRLVRIFRKSDQVESLFAFVKSQFPEGIEKPFEVFYISLNIKQCLVDEF